MTACRFSLEEVEDAYADTHGGHRESWWNNLRIALNALPEEPDLLAEAVELLRVIREADMLREHAYEDGSVYDQLRAFLAKVEK